MDIKINSDLKPLSANLKRLEMGFLFFRREFKHTLEENNLDNVWEQAANFHRDNNYIYDIDVNFEDYTEIFILALDIFYKAHINMPNENYNKAFNFLLKTGLIYFIENNKLKKDFSKILNALNSLSIVEKDTLSEIEKAINIYIIEDNDIIIKEKKFIPTMSQSKKYQIFISSTFVDLIEERQAAVEAILQKGHIPAGMELFSANDKSQWEVIKKWIDDSDIYLLLLGGRYGSISDETSLSYTQMEYDYAASINKPLFALILGDEIIDNKSREITKDYDLKDPKYVNFKSKVKSKMCFFPKNIDQIKLQINQSLDGLISDNKETLIGWIRGNTETAVSEKKKDLTEDYDKQQLPLIHDHSTVFVAERLASAFPGDRGIKWYNSEQAVKRLAIFFRKPLNFQVKDETQFDFEHSPVGDPIWWFRKHAALSINNFRILEINKVLIGYQELLIDRIAVNIDPSYYKSYIYVEVIEESPTGLRKYTKENIQDQIDVFGYASEQYALLGDRKITSEESDDGAAVIDDEVIEAFGAETRVRYISKYNFIICAKQSPYNSRKFQNETKYIFDDILKGTQTPEHLFNVLESFVKNQHSKE